jgi:hypothetical protein
VSQGSLAPRGGERDGNNRGWLEGCGWPLAPSNALGLMMPSVIRANQVS